VQAAYKGRYGPGIGRTGVFEKICEDLERGKSATDLAEHEEGSELMTGRVGGGMVRKSFVQVRSGMGETEKGEDD